MARITLSVGSFVLCTPSKGWASEQELFEDFYITLTENVVNSHVVLVFTEEYPKRIDFNKVHRKHFYRTAKRESWNFPSDSSIFALVKLLGWTQEGEAILFFDGIPSQIQFHAIRGN